MPAMLPLTPCLTCSVSAKVTSHLNLQRRAGFRRPFSTGRLILSHHAAPRQGTGRHLLPRDIGNVLTVFSMAKASAARYRDAVYVQAGREAERKNHHEGGGLLSGGYTVRVRPNSQSGLLHGNCQSGSCQTGGAGADVEPGSGRP